jgi:hypothetical protein
MLQIAFNSGYINENHFFFKLMYNTIENLVTKKKTNNFRYKEEIIHWCLLLRFAGGSKLWSILRGKRNAVNVDQALDSFNLIIPSVSTLKRYLPQLNFGKLSPENIKKIFKSCKEQNICDKVCISYDEVEVRSGLVYHAKSSQVIGFTCDNVWSSRNFYDNREKGIDITDVAHKICQFFCTTLDGRVSFPLCFLGYDDNHTDFIIKQMKSIK